MVKWLLCGCCGRGKAGRGSKPKREHRRRRHRRHHAAGAAPGRASTHRSELVPGTPLAATSVASDSEYHDAREAWSVTDGADQSPLSSAQVSPRAFSLTDHPQGDDNYEDLSDGGSSTSGSGSSESGSAASAQSAGFGAKLVSCLSIIRASSAGEEGTPHMHHMGSGGPRSHKLPAGCTFARRSPSDDPDTATLCWDECEASLFQIRSEDYMQSKLKQASAKAIYRLVGIDLFATDNKAYHIAKSFALPHTGPPVVCKPAVAGGQEVVLPPLLVMNVQLPDYPAAFWGANDGPGQSIVYYFALRDDFDPDKFENTAALGLLQRFVSNGRETDGSPTRDRLKMIVRVANLEEWARVAPLSATEYRLLQNYNEKPVLTRPQHAFHVGPNYLEVDLDVHNYAFLARKALWSYHDRLPTVVWDMGFVIQGNCPEELPEQILGCGRIYRSDFRRFKFLSDVVAPPAGLAAGGSGSATPNLAASSAPAAGRQGSAGAGAAAVAAAAAAGTAAAAAGGGGGAKEAGRAQAAAGAGAGAAAPVGPGQDAAGAAAAAGAPAAAAKPAASEAAAASCGSNGAADAAVLLPNGSPVASAAPGGGSKAGGDSSSGSSNAGRGGGRSKQGAAPGGDAAAAQQQAPAAAAAAAAGGSDRSSGGYKAREAISAAGTMQQQQQQVEAAAADAGAGAAAGQAPAAAAGAAASQTPRPRSSPRPET